MIAGVVRRGPTMACRETLAECTVAVLGRGETP